MEDNEREEQSEETETETDREREREREREIVGKELFVRLPGDPVELRDRPSFSNGFTSAPKDFLIHLNKTPRGFVFPHSAKEYSIFQSRGNFATFVCNCATRIVSV